MPKVSTDAKQIDWLLNHGVENVYPAKKALEARLAKGDKLRVYAGFDPTGPTLHLGHMITMKKLAELQTLGHEVIMLIGDFTAMIGDPTDKSAVRKKLTAEEVKSNLKLYVKQAERVLKFNGDNPAKVRYNSEWFGEMDFADVLELTSHFTVQQIAERDMFAKRIKEGTPVYLHEFLYPVMQGYDSVALDVDIEVGANDQTFNMLAGRDLMKELKKKEKFVIAGKLLVDASGKKMGKTEGNMIALTDTPEDMYGKVMSWTDSMIMPTFELCTDLSKDELAKIKKSLDGGENPIHIKKQLAHSIVAWLAGDEAADNAAESFSSVHQKGEKPSEIETVSLGKEQITLVDALVESGLCASKSDARRQVEQGGIKVADQVIKDIHAELKLDADPVLIQKGKRHFVNVRK